MAIPNFINLRGLQPEDSNTEQVLQRPLTNAEIDGNFIYLNNKKFSVDGSVPLNKITFNQQTSITEANGIYLDDDGVIILKGDVKIIDGELDAATTGSEELITTSISIRLDSGDPADPGADLVTSLADSSGGGLKIGLESTNSYDWGFANFLYNNSLGGWRAFAGDLTSQISLLAYDFKIINAGGSINSNTQSLRELNTNINEVNELLGTDGVPPSVNYGATTYSISNNTSLQTAISDLDAENIPSIQSFIGQSSVGGSTTYTTNGSNIGLGIEDGDSLLNAINAINSAMLYVIHKVQNKTSDFTAASSILYLVTPAEGARVTMSLPTSNKGIVGVRLQNESNSRSIKVVASNNNLIEGLAVGDELIIDSAYDTIRFLWDSTNQRWRIT